MFTSSAWPPDRRLVGARSARADQLRCLLALLKLREVHDEPSRLDAIIRRYAINVPRAIAPSAHLEPDRIASAAEAELTQISPLDDEECAEAAARFERLTLAEQIWGIEGGTATGGSAPSEERSHERQGACPIAARCPRSARMRGRWSGWRVTPNAPVCAR